MAVSVSIPPRPGDPLCERILDGDAEALGRLVHRLYVTLARVALLYLGNAAEAYEALQGLPRRAEHGLARLGHGAPTERWLLGLHLSELRARALSAGAVATTALDRSHAVAAPFVQRVDAGELDGLVRAVVSALPVDQREVVILRDVEALGAHEVGLLLGRPEREQRQLLHRARSSVARALDAHSSRVRAAA